MYIHLKTLGCRLNEAELETWAHAYQTAGHQITREPEQANLVIINSCSVTSDANRKSRQLIRRIHRSNPKAKLVVSGCYATLNPDEAADLLGVDMVISNADKDQLVHKSLTELDFDNMPSMSTEPGEFSLFQRGRQRAFVKVQDGCRYRCSFCIVTVARGDEISRPIQQIIDEINTLYQQGIQEVILTGVHLGGYGHDIYTDLSQLIQTILSATDIPRVRLGSLEPWELSDHFFQLFENQRLMPHLHLPLQSGSDSVLKRMARRCKTAEFTTLIDEARSHIAHFNVSTDIIVGFPGETESEWQQSYDYIKSVGFGQMHIFSYSPRTGTKAAEMNHQVPNATKKQRSQQLHTLAADMRHEFIQTNLGQTFDVLWEAKSMAADEQDEKQWVFGYTPNYLRVACQTDKQNKLENQILKAQLSALQNSYIETQLIT